MQLLLDNLIAIIVAASLAVLLLTQQTSTRQDTMERQSVYSAKAQTLSFASWIERDMVRLGARFGDDRERFDYTRPVTRRGVAFTDTLAFYYNERENNDGSADRIAVKYVLTQTDSVQVAKAPVRFQPVYRLERYEGAGRFKDGRWVNAAGATVPRPALTRSNAYGSPAGLMSFYIEPRTSDGAAITDPARATDADYMHVQFSVLPTLFPVYRARYINASGLSWASTFEIRPF